MQFLDGNANLPELPDGSTFFGTFKGNEEHDYLLSLPSSSGKGSAASLSSTDSILINGRWISLFYAMGHIDHGLMVGTKSTGGK